MRIQTILGAAAATAAVALSALPAPAQMGRRFPSEKKIVPDPVTGVPLSFLTSGHAGDSKIYQTHPQWTADGKWVIFRTNRVRNQVFAVNEQTGDIVQVTENGFTGMLCVARLSMKLYLMRDLGAKPGFEEGPPPMPQGGPQGAAVPPGAPGGRPGAGAPGAALAAGPDVPPPAGATAAAAPSAPGMPPGMPAGAPPAWRGPRGPFQIVEVDLGRLFADSAAGAMKPAATYERVCGTIPVEMMAAGGDMALDAREDVAYFRTSSPDLAKKLPPGTKVAETFGPRHMGAGPAGLFSMNLATGEIRFIVAVPFQIGHVQNNPWVPGEIIFCWETGGKAPQRTWAVNADGTALREVYAEASYDWVTHEAVATRDEVAIAILGHVPISDTPGQWGLCGMRSHPTGLAIVNLRTRAMRIIAQTPSGSGFWHVAGSPDGRWAAGDDFDRNLYLVDRRTGEVFLLSTGHKAAAADHIHPTFSADSTRIEIQSAMLAPGDGGESGPNQGKLPMNICVVPVPKTWLARTYSDRAPE